MRRSTNTPDPSVVYRYEFVAIKVAQSYLAGFAADWDDPLARMSAFLADPPR